MAGGAPALERGLAILEYLAAADEPVPFGRVLKALQIPRATGARLLQVLRASGYVAQDPAGGAYIIGPQLTRLVHRATERQRLLEAAGELLPALRDETGNTAALFHWRENGVEMLAKETHPDAVSMQPPGNRSGIPSNCPWWTLFLHELPAERRQALVDRAAEPAALREAYRDDIASAGRHGFAADLGRLNPGVRRLAARVRDTDGRLVATLVLGGTQYTIPDDRLRALGQRLAVAAEELSARLTPEGAAAAAPPPSGED